MSKKIVAGLKKIVAGWKRLARSKNHSPKDLFSFFLWQWYSHTREIFHGRAADNWQSRVILSTSLPPWWLASDNLNISAHLNPCSERHDINSNLKINPCRTSLGRDGDSSKRRQSGIGRSRSSVQQSFAGNLALMTWQLGSEAKPGTTNKDWLSEDQGQNISMNDFKKRCSIGFNCNLIGSNNRLCSADTYCQYMGKRNRPCLRTAFLFSFQISWTSPTSKDHWIPPNSQIRSPASSLSSTISPTFTVCRRSRSSALPTLLLKSLSIVSTNMVAWH